MTIRLPNPNIFDRILKLLGKKRGVILPAGNYEKFGQYAYVKASKESFWRALLRSGGEDLPDGYIDLSQIEDFRKEINSDEKKQKTNT